VICKLTALSTSGVLQSTASICRRGPPGNIGYKNNLGVPFEGENDPPRSNATPIRSLVWPLEWNHVSGQGFLFHTQQCLGYPLPISGRHPPKSPLSPIA
jgi:hypothetical protein